MSSWVFAPQSGANACSVRRMAESTVPSRASIAAGTPYGFQWWLHEQDGVVSSRMGAGDARLCGGRSVFYAIGNAGQAILVNRRRTRSW
ncbi:MAG: hypothetical protein ACOY4R_18715 [Pseudomonadota bacterium]